MSQARDELELLWAITGNVEARDLCDEQDFRFGELTVDEPVEALRSLWGTAWWWTRSPADPEARRYVEL